MKVLITDGCSEIGIEFTKVLSAKGYDLILIGKNKKKLEKINEEFNNNIQILAIDISSTYNCHKLYNKLKDENIEMIINCANTNMCGQFIDSKIDEELDLIDLNIKAIHTLTKLFLKDLEKKDCGYILNVSSTKSLSPYPLISTYCASKSYVSSLTIAINEELRRKKSNVYVGCFFLDDIINNELIEKVINQMFKKKTIIMPKFSFNTHLSKILPRKLISKNNYNKIKQG